ncbi:MAG TPA: hypothetical protein VFJ09_07525 [Nocardioidaceae bacterium]|nr:hypothetical protein [Nocardioidaceae bacterium]
MKPSLAVRRRGRRGARDEHPGRDGILAAAPADDTGESRAASVPRPPLRTGVGRIVLDGAVPLLAFWLARQLGGTVAGVLAATVSALGLLWMRRRSGARGSAAMLSAGLIAVNATIGLLARSDAVYLAQGVLTTAVMGVVFAVTATTPRPLAGVLAADVYSLRVEVWHEEGFVRTFQVISWVWAAFELLSAGLRALVLSSTDLYVAVSFLLGTPGTLALFWWSLRYANKRLLR